MLRKLKDMRFYINQGKARNMKLPKTSKGFSLIELIIVIAIIGILAAVVIPNMIGTTDRAHQANVDAVGGAIKSGVEIILKKKLASGGTGSYPHGTQTADHAGTGNDVNILNFLLKTYDDSKWSSSDCTYNFSDTTISGVTIPAGSMNAAAAVEFSYDPSGFDAAFYYVAYNLGSTSVNDFANRTNNDSYLLVMELKNATTRKQ